MSIDLARNGSTRRSFLGTAAGIAASASLAASLPEHPRLYYHASDLARLRSVRGSGIHARIWSNMRHSAEEFLSAAPPPAIPHGRRDILYHDLYVMFYHALTTMAMLEHFTFSYVLSGHEPYFEQARRWMNAILGWERGWGAPYLFSRYLHSIAVFYDCCYSHLDESERGQIRSLLTDQLKVYERDVFQKHLGDPSFATHHATIYFSCGGVAALALLGEVPDAARWVNMVKQQFTEAILPYGFGIDGAQEEGKTFWASQNLYRFFFLDALRNTTGENWYEKFREPVERPTLYGIESFLGGKIELKDHFDSCENIAFSADYGQLNYYAPPLLHLAGMYRNPQAQWVALQDKNLGRIQQSNSGVPGIAEPVVFCQGPYAYLWYDETLAPSRPTRLPLGYRFRDAEQVIMRSSWDDDALIMALEGRSPGSAAVTDFMLHYGGKTIVSYLYLEGKNLPFNQVAPNTLEFRGIDQLNATVQSFFSGPSSHYVSLDADRYKRTVFFLPSEVIVMVDEVSVDGILANEIRWQLHSLGDIKVNAPGDVELSVEDARLRMRTLYPGNPEYRISHSRMSRTTGGGNVKLIDDDPREFPYLDFALKSEAKSLQPIPPLVITVFSPATAAPLLQGGVQGGAAFVRIGEPNRETLVAVRRDRVAKVGDIYTDGEGALVHQQSGRCEAFALLEGGVLLYRSVPLISCRGRINISMTNSNGQFAGTFSTPNDIQAELSSRAKPNSVRIDRHAVEVAFHGAKIRLVLPAGTHRLQIMV